MAGDKQRVIVWVSAGAASAVAGKLAQAKHGEVIFAYCETGGEHPDNVRFLADLESWYGQEVIHLRSEKYASTWEVWEDRSYLAGIDGAPCTRELKMEPRLKFQRPGDLHVFGYTADKPDILRANRLRLNWPDMLVETPLIDGGLDKRACLAMVENAGMKLPVLYGLGFPNNNCIPCVKATSPAYWSLVRREFPDEFDRIAKLSRKLDVRLCRLPGDVRAFIDEIPADFPVTQPTVPTCDFLCHLAEMGLKENAA